MYCSRCMCELHILLDYRPALSLMSFTSDFSERLSTFTYSYQESCSLYPRCTPYFSDAVQSLAINHTNGSVTLFLPLSKPLPEDAVTLNMTKYNTVPTNRSDVTGNIVTKMVTWGTSAVFGELELITRHVQSYYAVLQLLMLHDVLPLCTVRIVLQ